MKQHTFNQVLPPLSEVQHRNLRDSIDQNGQIVPILTYKGAILDGYHRWIICEELGIEPNIIAYEGDSPLAQVKALNAHRRHLKPADLTTVIMALDKAGASYTAKEVAELTDSSERSVYRAKAEVRTQRGEAPSTRGRSKLPPVISPAPAPAPAPPPVDLPPVERVEHEVEHQTEEEPVERVERPDAIPPVSTRDLPTDRAVVAPDATTGDPAPQPRPWAAAIAQLRGARPLPDLLDAINTLENILHRQEIRINELERRTREAYRYGMQCDPQLIAILDGEDDYNDDLDQ